MQQTEYEGTFPSQVDVDGFLHVDYIRIPEQEGTSYFQAGVGVNPKTTTVQVAACQEFSKLPRGLEPAKDRIKRARQAVSPGRVMDN